MSATPAAANPAHIATPEPSGLSDAEYEQRSSALLAQIEATADHWLDEDIIDLDPMRSGGLLELSFADGSKIIVNTQQPLHEVWLAARAGGYHYRWRDGQWMDSRDGTEFWHNLSAQASAQGGQALKFSQQS
jgi:CyaY protein